MAVELVRVRVGDIEKNMSKALAESSKDVEILDEPVRDPSGRLRGETRTGGRPVKPRTSVAKKAAEKQAVTASATNQKEQDQ